MFYADFVLSKKGPLARIWLAAHWDRKITKSQVFETNIEKSVDGILQPSIKMALRTSGHLLLGVVRIYSRKAKYLLADCNEAFVKIKMAFRPGVVDLPEDHRETAVSAVTLPEVFHDFDNAIPDFKYMWGDMDIEVQFSVNQSRVDEITMREDNANAHLGNEYRFDDASFDAGNSDILRDSAQFNQSLNQANLLLAENIGDLMQPNVITESTSFGNQQEDDNCIDDDFNETLRVTDGELFRGGLFDDTPMPDVPLLENDSFDTHQRDEQMELEHAVHSVSKSSPRPEENAPNIPSSVVTAVNEHENDDYDDDDHFIPPSPGAVSSDDSRPPTPALAVERDDQNNTIPLENGNKVQSPTHLPSDPRPWSSPVTTEAEGIIQPEEERVEPASIVEDANDNADQTTIMHNEEGTFALLPVDASAVRGMSKPKRKRKLIVDEIKNISGDEMKAQLNDTSDIVTSLDLAPPTKRLMHWKETGGVEKLFALPGKNIPARHLFKNYQRFLTSRSTVKEDGPRNDQIEAEHIKENIPPVDLNGDNAALVDQREPEQVTQTRRGRKRKIQLEEEEQNIKDKEQDEAPPVKRNSLVPSTNALSPHNSQNKDTRILSVTEESSNIGENFAQVSPKNPQDEQTIVAQPEIDLQLPSELDLQPQPMDVVENEVPPAEEHTVAVNGISELICSPRNEVVKSPEPQPITVDNISSSSILVDVPINDNDRIDNKEDNVTECGEQYNAELENAPIIQNDDSLQINGQNVDAHENEPFDKHDVLPPFSPQLQSNVGGIVNSDCDLQNQNAEIENGYGDDGFGFNNVSIAGAGGGGSTPWHDDYECPPSVSQCMEQVDNETTEEFEERVLNKRANNLYHSIRAVVSEESGTIFSNLVRRNNRKQVAQKFYSLLVLKKFKVLELDQNEPYGEITLKPGLNFNDPRL